MISSDPRVGEIRLSATVMTHPGRIDEARRLRDQYPELGLQVVCDPKPDRKGINLDAAQASWSSVADWATHHLVIEDDAILCSRFAERLMAVIAAQPHAAVALFAEWGSLSASVARMAALHGTSFSEVVDHYFPHQAAVLPADLARGFDAFAQSATGPKACDVVMHRYLRSEGVQCYVSVPNLAEHGDLPSLVGARSEFQGRRKAVCYLSEPPVADEGVLAGARVVPNLVWMKTAAVFDRRDEDGRDHWMPVPAVELLAEHGMADPALSEAFSFAVSSLTDAGHLRDRVGDRALGELWTAAFSLGLAALGTGQVPDDPATRPVARQALATLAPGGLRRLVPPGELDWLADRLAPLTLAAVRFAVGEVKAGRAVPIS